MTTLRLGTRKSLLAWTQSSQVAASLEAAHPGLKVELVGIVTQGDLVLDKPLSQIEGKEFFVKEIDTALQRGEVDFTVHSMKDLSVERPAWTTLGAIPLRQFPHDVLIAGPQIMQRLAAGRVSIGTSSPRRLQNLPSFLEKALPHQPALEFREIRGNVNTRLKRLHASLDDDDYLDAIVLAAAGLNRLALDEEAGATLAGLLGSCRLMLLPLSVCPTAPAQGALAIECRKDDRTTQEYLRAIHDEEGAALVDEERRLMATWGGGCHQKFGITAMRAAGLTRLLYKKGVLASGEVVDDIDWSYPGRGNDGRSAVSGRKLRGEGSESCEVQQLSSQACFVTNARAAADDGWLDQIAKQRVWVAGVASWFKLAAQGVWVEGCSDGLGRQHLQELVGQPCLDLPSWGDWSILTHQDGLESWRDRRGVFATYRIDYELPQDVVDLCGGAGHIYWTSASQFRRFGSLFPADVRHACGPGATRSQLEELGVSPLVFPSHEHWQKWLEQEG